mgnify:CR=1 FL=1
MLILCMAHFLCRAEISSGAFMFSTRLDVYRHIGTDDLVADFFLDVVGNVVCFLDREMFTDSQVEIDQLL